MDSHKIVFDKNGYVLIKDFFSEEEAKNIVRYADELETWTEQANKWMIYFEESKRKSRIENFLEYHSETKALLDNRIRPLVEKIYGAKMNLFKEKLNWKYGNGNGFKAHQDQPAWSDFEPDRFVSVAMFANNCTSENGCLEFGISDKKFTEICGYNKGGLGEINKEIENELEWIPAITTPRDILLFDSYVPHRSHKNTTENPRRIFYFTFNEEKYGDLYSDYLVKKRTEFPPDIERVKGQSVSINGNKYNLANPTL